MKRYLIFVMTLVLTAVLLTGCGCTNQNMGNTSAPTLMPTETTRATTAPTTAPTTAATTAPTQETADRGNGPLDTTDGTTNDTTQETTGAAANGNTRSGMGGSLR